MTTQRPIVTIMTIINVMMSTGPLIVPCVFLIGGYILATIFIVLMGSISMISCGFCVESLSISNAIKAKLNINSNIQTQNS